MKFALSAVMIVAVSACGPAPTTPSAFGPGSGQQLGQAAPPGASCRATLECYASCDMTQDCMASCDQRAGAEDVALAHASMSCIGGSECGADQDCVVERCGAELTACTEIAMAPAPSAMPAGQVAGGAPAAGTGSLDLVYAVPSGWSEQRSADAVTLSWKFTDSYNNISYTLVILASQPLRGTLTETYHALWAEIITPHFTPALSPAVVPAPMRRRLASGFTVAFDGDLLNSNRGGMFTTVLYLIASDDRVVPVLGMFGELDAAKGEPILRAFFDSATIAGVSPPRTPLFDPSELVGEWSTQASEYANYVDGSGTYVRDSNIAVRQDHTFNADGSYSAYASAYQSDRGFDRESSKGTWRVEDDTVVIDAGGKPINYRIFAAAMRRGVRSLYLPPSYAPTTVIELTRPRSVGDWYGRVR